jgi:Sulfotransferase domain
MAAARYREQLARQKRRWRRVVDRRRRLAQRSGWGSVVAADARRARLDSRRLLWGLRHDCRPNATPLYVIGLQRSGTTMLMRAFERTPEAEVHHEAMDSKAFSRYELRSDAVVRGIVTSSRQRCVVFKPLIDSHRVVHLIEDLGTPTPGRAIWMYRNVADRIRSYHALWPERTADDGRKVAAGYEGWESGGLSAETLALAQRFDSEDLSPAASNALFWYLRNVMYFDLGLEQRPDVTLMSYDRFVAEPDRFMRDLCRFSGIAYRPEMIDGIARRPPPTAAVLEIEPEVAELCAGLESRLDDEFERRLAG